MERKQIISAFHAEDESSILSTRLLYKPEKSSLYGEKLHDNFA